MSASQFTVYSSSDVGGPGLIAGQAGTLLALLDACLVNGYAGKPAAGWTKPFANSGNIGCYKQGAGALLSLLVNDNGPNVTSSFEEAWLTGWESIASIAAPVGTGSGQFPTPAQSLTTGHVVCRKSAAISTAGRNWVMFADASTFYLFIYTGDFAGRYYPICFGDVFSMGGASDAYRCILIGRNGENNNSGIWAGLIDEFDVQLAPYTTTSAFPINVALEGHFMARTAGGGGASIAVGKGGDTTFGTQSLTTYTSTAPNRVFCSMSGMAQNPNSPDNSIYLSPIRVFEPGTGMVRGRMRGLWQVCHAPGNFADGQVFSGGGDYAGKSFMIVNGCTNAGFFALEISATVETN